MASWLAVALLWAAFAAAHMVPSSPGVRSRLVQRLGERGYLALYSLLALGLFVPLVWVYLEHRHEGPQLWANPLGPLSLWLLYGAMGVAFVLVVGGLVQPSPASLMGARSHEPRGVHRITRHPLFMGFGLFGALHLIPNGSASDVAFFAGFPLFALLGCWHQDRRKRGTLGESYAAWCAKTPFLPFAGRESWRGVRELSPAVILIGVALTVLLRELHGPLFR